MNYIKAKEHAGTTTLFNLDQVSTITPRQGPDYRYTKILMRENYYILVETDSMRLIDSPNDLFSAIGCADTIYN